MENASRALLFAAEVLIGVIILSIGVVLFTMFQNYSKDVIEDINDSQVTEFNSNFTKYYLNTYADDDLEKLEPIEVSAHDILSVVNFARENNLKYDLKYSDVQGNVANTMYVQVDLKLEGKTEQNHIEESWNENDKYDFLRANSLDSTEKNKKIFKCTACDISSSTKRVYHIRFEEVK